MKATRFITKEAVIAALYFVLTLLQSVLFPESASMAIQFRASEALCVLALFTPSAVYGLTLGCLLSNLLFAGTLPLDFFIGTLATLLATWSMYRLRNVLVWKLPLPALMMPVVCNALLVGGELTIYLSEMSFWTNALFVGLGELGVMATLGIGLWFACKPLSKLLR